MVSSIKDQIGTAETSDSHHVPLGNFREAVIIGMLCLKVIYPSALYESKIYVVQCIRVPNTCILNDGQVISFMTKVKFIKDYMSWSNTLSSTRVSPPLIIQF